MFFVFICITVLLSFLFLHHYFPFFKDADDLFSIAGFFLIFLVIAAFIAVVVFTPYYLIFE